MKKILALALALVLVFSLAACGEQGTTNNGGQSSEATATPAPTNAPEASNAPAEGDDENSGNDAQANDPYANPYANPYDNPYSNPYADPNSGSEDGNEEPDTGRALKNDEYIPEDGEKYTVTETDDGWLLIENEDGDTLGLSKYSGVEIIEEDGYAFKDLNQNGKLDVYEDWRESSEDRAADLVAQMEGAEMAAILAHGGWGDFTTEPLTADDGSYTYLIAGGRGGVTRNIGRGGSDNAKWANAIQEVAESCYYGIPAMISIDPSNVSGLIETVELAATMDAELAAAIGQETAKEYRAAGVTALLGPQVDISSPVMVRSNGTYGEDPQLTLDIATAYVNGMQSTYDANGNDLGWGDESVYCFTKHFAGAGATEGGRDDHAYNGRYAVFPGNNYAAHLITYFDGVFSLPGLTKTSGIMTEYAVNVDGEGNPFTETDFAGAYNYYQYGMLKEFGYDGLTITDWGVFGDFGPTAANTWATGTWGTEDMSMAERMALVWKRGGMLLGGNGSMDDIAEAWKILRNDLGKDDAEEVIGNAAYHYIRTMMNLNMFDNPYCDSAYADEIVYSDSANEYGLDTQRQSVVMIKNDGTIKEGGDGIAKPKVYIPYISNDGFSVNSFMGYSQGDATAEPGMDLDIMEEYFDVVTDTARGGEITRASEEDIADCDYILVGMVGAYSVSYNRLMAPFFAANYELPEGDEVWYPVSLQYGEYSAPTARDPSISGITLEDGSRENRSYKDVSRTCSDYGSLEALEYAASVAGDIPVIVSVNMGRGMVWSEVEPLADVILVCYNSQKNEAVAEIILGELEPNGLLVFQQPASMEAVEAQVDDVPRDMECYVDADGNTYDFAFGLNWSGVINDQRVSAYSAAPLTAPVNFDYASYEAAHKGAAEVAE